MVSYIYTFTKRVAIKLGRVMTYCEGSKMTWRGHMKSGEVVWHTVDVISTPYLHRGHMAPYIGGWLYCWESLKNIKAKSNVRSLRMRS